MLRTSEPPKFPRLESPSATRCVTIAENAVRAGLVNSSYESLVFDPAARQAIHASLQIITAANFQHNYIRPTQDCCQFCSFYLLISHHCW